jgi:hypothetical protein
MKLHNAATNYLYSFPSVGLRPVETAGIEAWEEDTATVSTLDLGSESTPDVQCYVNTKDAPKCGNIWHLPTRCISLPRKQTFKKPWSKLDQMAHPKKPSVLWYGSVKVDEWPTFGKSDRQCLFLCFVAPCLSNSRIWFIFNSHFHLSELRNFADQTKKGKYTWDAIIEGKLPPEDFWYGLLHTL